MNNLGVTAASTAALSKHKQTREEEEERLTSYTKEDLTAGWEFKIVRSNNSMAGERFTNLCREEAENGWQLVEKFDNHRIRFKRQITNRANDHASSIDSYRTRVGISDGAIIGIVLAAIPIVLLIVYLVFMMGPANR